jgi:hypothetical protein
VRKSGSVCTVTRRAECASDNGEQQLGQDFEICESLAFSYMHQLTCFLFGSSSTTNVIKQLLKTIPLRGKNTREDYT